MKTIDGAPLNREERRWLRALLNFTRECFPFRLDTTALQTSFEFTPTLAPAFQTKLAEALAERLITGVLVANRKTWRAAASESLQGKRIYETLRNEGSGPVGRRAQELIARNARLIESIPDKLNERAQKFIARESQAGRRAAEIAQDLRKKLPGFTKSQIALLARTEVSRADTALTQARSEQLGLDWYEWNTSRDARVRPSHREMAGVLVAWSDPPSPEALIGQASSLGKYHAGCTFNCRCLALPLVSLDEVKWPKKIYTGGEIVRVTRAQFTRLARMLKAA